METEVIRLLQDEYDFYKTKSQKELLETLVQLTAEQKANGELDAAAMEDAYRMIAPLLSDDRKQTLRALLDALK